MHKNATKCNETLSKWCENKHGASKIIDTFETYHLLAEILLRLIPKPSTLPRASAICTCWRGVVNDPGFLRHFCLRHRRNAPVVSFFRDNYQRPSVSFVPALEAPDRIPDECFSLPIALYDSFMLFNCRHGLLLLMLVTTRGTGSSSCGNPSPENNTTSSFPGSS
jgi:hypothetical protein